MYCSEAANIVNQTLTDLGEFVNFSYYPVPHLNADNEIICEQDGYQFDCEARYYEQCIMAENCWVPGGCDRAMQMKISQFLSCWEGPDANLEEKTNLSQLVPCLNSTGLAADPVLQCYGNKTREAELGEKMRDAKIPMMAGLGDPSRRGTFPHIFINGVHQWDYGWAALTRLLCDEIGYQTGNHKPPPCRGIGLRVSFDLPQETQPNVTWTFDEFELAVSGAMDVAISAEAFPVGFDEADPKYVNVRAVKDCWGGSWASDGMVLMQFSVYNAFLESALNINSDQFGVALVEALGKIGIIAEVGDVTDLQVLRPEVAV